ncbi:MAG: hypothetical protein M3Q30_18280 [Actinomycetota bacterium]|nr:hypothetical protein [Actinomycetota bacterium]
MSGPEPADHWVEVERLWRAIKRDVLFVVELSAGFQKLDDAANKRAQRLSRNWRHLCELDMDIAAAFAHGFREMSMIASTDGVWERTHQKMNEVIELARIGREANPDAEVQTLGELVELAEEAIRREINDDLDGL